MHNLILLVKRGDRSLLYFINHRLRCDILDHFMALSTNFGGATFTISFSISLFIWGEGDLKIAANRGLISLTTSFILGYLIKKIFERPRPYLVLPDTYTGTKLFKDFAFPSGHTTASFSLAVSYALAYPYLALPLISLAFLIGISRIYLGQHYPTDVIVGGLLGTTTAFLTGVVI